MTKLPWVRAELCGALNALVTAVEELALSEAPTWEAVRRREDAEACARFASWKRRDVSTRATRRSGWLFAEQAAARGDAIALESQEGRITYAELERRLNQIARRLIRLGVGAEVRVGVSARRGLGLYEVLVGILKAGGAYVPLDPEEPRPRLERMIKEAGVLLVLADEALEAALAESSVPVVFWPEEARYVDEESTDGIDAAVGGEHLAYVMFTSGSTGAAKATGASHRGVIRLVRGSEYVEWQDQVFLQSASVAFDASTFEILGIR